MKVYAFEGPHEVYVFGSTALAEDYFEAIDVENDEYVFFGADGTLIEPSVRDGRVVLTLTAEQQPVELRARLRTYLQHSRVAEDLELAENPSALADLLMEDEQTLRWPRWLRFRRFR
jgi:hypothetical protein